jgi:hypothetical protein
MQARAAGVLDQAGHLAGSERLAMFVDPEASLVMPAVGERVRLMVFLLSTAFIDTSVLNKSRPRHLRTISDVAPQSSSLGGLPDRPRCACLATASAAEGIVTAENGALQMRLPTVTVTLSRPRVSGCSATRRVAVRRAGGVVRARVRRRARAIGGRARG